MASDTEKEILKEIGKLHQRMTDSNIADEKFRKEVKDKLDPMYSIFSSVQGFNGVSIWILKILGLLGVALVGFYSLIEFIKKLAK